MRASDPLDRAVPLALDGWRGVRAGGFDPARLSSCLSSTDPGELVKSTGRKSPRHLPSAPPVAITRYALFARPARWLRRSRAIRAFRAAERLLAIGIPAARPLFAARGPREERLGVEWIPGAQTLTAAVYAGALPPGPSRTLARLVARAHASGIRLRDLRAENILLGGDGRIVFVDFDGVRKLRTGRKAADDLSRLSASFPPGGPVTDAVRMRFLARYLRERAALGGPVSDPHAFARRAARRTRQRWRRWERRGFTLSPRGLAHADAR